jgi:hypothetical protein
MVRPLFYRPAPRGDIHGPSKGADMKFVLDVPVVGRLLGRAATREAESDWRRRLPWGAIAIVVVTAVWIALGAGVLATLDELGPLITQIRAR